MEPQSVLSDNPSPYEVTNSESEGDDVVAYDTETSHHTTVANRHWLYRKQWLRHECCECRCQKHRWARRATLPLFKNSSKEGATMYIDSRNSVDELIADKLDKKRIWSLVLQSLEGPPKDTASLAYKNEKGSLKDILQALDKLYSRSASYMSSISCCNHPGFFWCWGNVGDFFVGKCGGFFCGEMWGIFLWGNVGDFFVGKCGGFFCGEMWGIFFCGEKRGIFLQGNVGDFLWGNVGDFFAGKCGGFDFLDKYLSKWRSRVSK